jgi:hypothetical protein
MLQTEARRLYEDRFGDGRGNDKLFSPTSRGALIRGEAGVLR